MSHERPIQPAPGGPVPAKVSTKSSDTDVAIVNQNAELRVWIDQDLCTGDGICTDHAPQVFTILEDGIAYCVEETAFGRKVFNDPGGSAELAKVPREMEAAVVHATAECPGECIFIEVVELSPEERTNAGSKIPAAHR